MNRSKIVRIRIRNHNTDLLREFDRSGVGTALGIGCRYGIICLTPPPGLLVGGRLATLQAAGREYEIGGSVIHPANREKKPAKKLHFFIVVIFPQFLMCSMILPSILASPVYTRSVRTPDADACFFYPGSSREAYSSMSS